MRSILDGFHPAIRMWFTRSFAAPSRAQELGWPAIGESQADPSHDVLLCAPTGSGKTLAAFMWAINRLVVEAQAGILTDEVSVLYVSPLKALANDIRLNLEEPLSGVRAVASELGFSFGVIRAGLRTGDTPASERNAMLRRPPHILVTTPESLFILLTSPRFREKLRSVRFVIVDELHAIASSKRGTHLMITLERLERMVRRAGSPRPIRIGLSATLNPIERLAAFLAGAEADSEGASRPCPVKVVRANDLQRRMDLAVVAPGPELGALATHQHWEAMYDAVAQLIRDHRTTLVFTLSRRWAERIALALQKRLGNDTVMAHHGSLARAERLMAEQRLKRGELKAIVATASLELGIDVGAVDLVCQIDSPKSISAAVQRIGRSGHRLGATPKGRFFALTIDDLLECAAALRAIRHGKLDEVEIPEQSLDVAAQQIVAIASEEEEISTGDLLRLLRSSYNFTRFDSAQLDSLLSEMAWQLPERIQGAAPKIFYDRVTGTVRARRGGRLAAITSGGTIPESGNYDVVIASENRKIGDVEEDFAQESSRGDIFSLGSMPWRVLGISRNRFMVEAAPGMAPSLPFWQTEAAGRSPVLSSEVSDIRRQVAAMIVRGDDGPKAATEWLCNECSLEETAARQLTDYIRRGVAALGAVPDERTLIVERFFDGLGGTQIVIHSPFGIRLNRGFGLALRKRLCQSFDFEIQASAIDDAVLLALNSRHSFPLERIVTMVTAKTVRDVLIQAVLDAPMFEVRFRHVATRALNVMRSMRGRRVPAWIQRLRTQELITALFPQRNACFENRPASIDIPDHFIVRETISECLEESTDLKRLLALMQGIEDGSVRVVAVDSVAPSVFAHRVLVAWDYSFLDDGERANRRSRTVAMNRAAAEEVFRSEGIADLLSADAIHAVTAEVQARVASRRARNADELHELIRSHGTLAPGELDERVTGDAGVLVAALEAQGRVLRARLVPQAPEILLATEDAALIAAAFPLTTVTVTGDGAGAIAPPRGATAPSPENAREEMVRRALATSGPVAVDGLATRLLMPPDVVAPILEILEAKGAIFRGHFIPGTPTEEQWCDRYVLERIHRETLNLLRAEVEPCTDAQFAAFRMQWQHLGGAGISADHEGLRTVLHQLSGLAFTPEFWERSILAARIPHYRPEMLDLLCLSGEVVWIANPETEDGFTDAIPSRVMLAARGIGVATLPSTLVQVDNPRDNAVLDTLRKHGAQYLDRLADRAGASERDALASLWRLAAAGLVSNDSFAPLRLLAAESDAVRSAVSVPDTGVRNRHDAALRARLKSSLNGRWSAVEFPATTRDGEATLPSIASSDRSRELVELLLARHGILTREMLSMEPTPLAWQDLSFALRRMEYSGAIRRGYFVRSLSGEQYALPGALEMLREVQASEADAQSQPLAALSAADPANPFGVLIPGCGVPRDSANSIVVQAGKVVAGLAGRALLISRVPVKTFELALRALIELRSRLVIETIDNTPALESPWVSVMAAAGFHSDGRALVYDGLPGPMPLRAAGAVLRSVKRPDRS